MSRPGSWRRAGIRCNEIPEVAPRPLTQTRTLLLGQFGSAVTIGALLIAAIRL